MYLLSNKNALILGDKVKKVTNAKKEKPYLSQSVTAFFVMRAPWLILLMLSNTFTSLILSGYEDKLAALRDGALLYAFIPMLMGTAGNAGGQTSVTVIRALALEQVHPKNIFRILLKELAVAFLLALTLASVCFLKLYFLDSLYAGNITARVALVISVVLFIAVIISKIVGCLLPLFAKAIRLDPAVVASPFMTTIVDALSLIVYCSLCVTLL